MNFICLSLAPNLRCQNLTKIQSIIIFIPAAVEAFFSLVLALADSSLRGRKRWVLVCDGLSFFTLALLDFLAHLLSGISTSQPVFSAIDFTIAAASFIPILAYLLFLFLFARSNLAKSIPSRFRRILTISLSLIIPLTIVFSELGSLLGITHQTLATAGKLPELAVGFTNNTFQHISLFFSSATLIFLVLFQATLFTLAFVRVVRAFIDERRVENDHRDANEPAEQIYLFRGLGWLSVGLKLGAIESVVGFADTSFAVVLTRRLLRLFGRGALIVGVIKGLNIVEDFIQFETDVRTIRTESTRTNNSSRQRLTPTSRPVILISNPRTSTFHQLSPGATSFHAAQLEKRAQKFGPPSLILGSNSTFNRFNGLNSSAAPQRVTVHWDGKAAPVLNVRFSTLNFPLPVLPIVNKVPLSTVEEHSRETGESSQGGMLSPDPSPLSRGSSMNRRASDSLSEAVRDLASRFPSLPPRAKPPISAYDYDHGFPSRMPSRESLRSDRRLSTEVGISAKQVAPSTPFDNPLRNQNVRSRFSMSTYSGDEGESYRESFHSNKPMNQSPPTTPGLSSAFTTDATSVAMSLSSRRLESTLSGAPATYGASFPISENLRTRSFNARYLSPFMLQKWSNEAEGQYEMSLQRTHSPDIDFTDDVIDYARRGEGLARVKSVSPAQRTPPARMSPMRRSMYGIEDGEMNDSSVGLP